MKRVSEAELDAYLSERERRRNGRLLAARFFQGTVTAVIPTSPPLIQIRRVGEGAPDGNTYACAVPGYYPALGDLVELCWRDEHTAHVVHPLGTAFGNTGPGRFARVTVNAGAWLGGGPNTATSFTQLVAAPWKTVEIIWQANASADSNLFIQVNQDITGNYFGNRWVMSGATGTGFQDNGATSNSVGMVPATGTFGSGRILIHSRQGSHGIGWEISSQANYYAGATGSMQGGGTYIGNGPLTSVTLLGPTFQNGEFDFYGYPP